MDNLWANYQQLLVSVAELNQLSQAQRLEDFLLELKTLWACPSLSDQELLDQLNLCNQTALANTIDVAGNWMPYRYQASTQRVDWLFPIAYPREPFLDEYISCCRQNLVNQLIRPFTHLQTVRELSTRVTAASPAGFIFHLSRCGSTLVSGCLSELETTCVFSEPPLLTELLLDAALSVEEKQASLRVFIDLQAAAFPDKPQVIIKWNAWDIFYWDLIRGLYPQVPVLFLVRDPVEILASHQKLTGRHMSGEPGLTGVAPVFGYSGESLLAFRIKVLRQLLEFMAKLSTQPRILIKDYSQLNPEAIGCVGDFFNLALTKADMDCVRHRMFYNAKEPGKAFVADSASKREGFGVDQRLLIESQLMTLYKRICLSDQN